MAIENLDAKIQGIYDRPSNLYPFLRELAEGGSVPEDIYVDNCFVDEEFEFTDSDADFGTVAKGKINDAVDDITASKIDSESAAQGSVLIANGSGIAAFAKLAGENILCSAGDAGKMLTAKSDTTCEWSYPTAGNISSGEATSGQVLKANGSGGASWGSLSNNATFSLSGTTLTITNS